MGLQINGVEVAAPKTFKVNVIDLDSNDTTRNAKGVLLRDRLRVMRTIDCEWGPLTSSEISAILQIVSPTGVSVTYPDPMSGQDETRTMYAGNRVAPAYDFNLNTWLGLTMTLTEL
jgi:hypothetical protein